MAAKIDRKTARRHARRILGKLEEGAGLGGAVDASVELKELCGLHRSPYRGGSTERASLRALGGVAREVAERGAELAAPGPIESLRRELGEAIAAGFRRMNSVEDSELRSVLLRDLWTIVEVDFDRAMGAYPGYLKETFREGITEAERTAVEAWFREKLAEYPESESLNSQVPPSRRAVAGHWMIEYVGEELSAEEFEAVCEETGQYARLVKRSLEEGRIDDALEWGREVKPERAADLCWAFCERGQLGVLVEAGGLPDPELQPIPGDELLDTALMLVSEGFVDEAAPWLRVAAREMRLTEVLDETRRVAEEDGEWGPEVKNALLGEVREEWPREALAFHLRFGDAAEAFELWEAIEDWTAREERRAGEQILQMADVDESAELVLAVATTVADSLIEQRGRDNYADACESLKRAREVVEGSELPVSWEVILEEYEERMERLPALRDEAAKAGLTGGER